MKRSGPVTGIKGLRNRAGAHIGRTVSTMLFRRSVVLSSLFLLVPTFIALYTLIDPPQGSKQWEDLFGYLGLFLFLQLIIMIFSLIYGSSLVHEDLDRRTMTYLIIRGSKRAEVLIMRFIGTYISLSFMFLIASTLTFVVLSFHSGIGMMVENIPDLLALQLAILLGTFAYLSFFTFLGVVFKHPLVIGLLISFFWEILMVNIPLNVQKVTLMYHIRMVFMVEPSMTDVFGVDKTTVPGAIMVLLVFGLLFLVLGSVFFSRKDIN